MKLRTRLTTRSRGKVTIVLTDDEWGDEIAGVGEHGRRGYDAPVRSRGASHTSPGLLTPSTVGSHLAQRGIVSDGAEIITEELGGGVSNVVLGVEADGTRLVVKQALPRLRVADDWVAKRQRALTEAAAIELVHRATPEAVPPVLDVDEASCAIVIGRAPRTWATWKQLLLAGRIDTQVSTRLGSLLAAWHGLDVQGACRLDDPEAFEQLRVDPYYRTVARRAPDLAPEISALIERMVEKRRCLVHGDFSPKNVLVGQDGLWVIDFEVAHLGDPAFDVAFMTSHLVLKAIHRPVDRHAYATCAERFWFSYRNAIPATLAFQPDHILRHLGALLLARVDGKSPAEYLTAVEHDVTRALGRRLVLEPPDSLDEVWTLVTEANA